MNTITLIKRSLFTVILMLSSCSSPSTDGIKAARNENRCAEKCLESIQRLESDFVSQFNPKEYTYRQQASDAYLAEFKRIGDIYQQSLDISTIQKSKLKGHYADNYKDIAKFEAAYEEEKNAKLQASAINLIASSTIPSAVIASINRIIPPKPDEERITTDFTGHSLSEGFERKDCFFSESWKRTIGEKVTIIGLHIDDVLINDEKEYVFVASMVLKEEYLSYNAKVQVYYTLPSGEDWKMDFAKSLGIRVIQTHKYDDCIHCVIEDDGWGGVDALFISNTSEAQLLVIGHIKTEYDNKTLNFSKLIPAGEKAQVGGLFGGGSVYDYDIVLVERES